MRPIHTLAVFHLAEMTGPAHSLRPRLEALAGGNRGSLEVLVPGDGSLERSYRGIAETRTLPYEPLTVPANPVAAAAAIARLRREVKIFRREFRRRRPDLVVVVTAVLPAALIAARLERLPTILYVGEIFSKGYLEGRLRHLGGRAIARLSDSLADQLVCCSETVASQFNGSGKAVAIYPGVSRSYASGEGASFRRRYGLEDASPLLAVVGNLSPGRGQDLAVQALSRVRDHLPTAQLVFAGAPPRPADEAFCESVRTLAAELELEPYVTFAGFVEDTTDLYAAADVVVNPARFNEPFGRVAVEALMAGRPVVAAAVGAVPEVLEDGRDALLVPREDVDRLAAAIVRVASDGELRDRLVSEGRRRVVKQFSEDQGVDAFRRVVEQVLVGAQGAGLPAASAAEAA